MAFQNIDNSAISLGKILQIAFSEGVRNQLSEDYKDWEMLKSYKADLSHAREVRFMFQNSLNPASVQTRNPGVSNRALPKGFQPAIAEHTAKMKVMQATIDIEYDLWDRARKSPEKYAEPLALIVDSTMISTKRYLANTLYLDGTGVMGAVKTASQTVSSGKLVFTLESAHDKRGGVQHFEYGDILVLKASDGTASAIDTNLGTEPVYWQVDDRDRENNTVTLQGLDSSYAEVTITSVTTPAAAGEVFYKYDQQVIPDLDSAISDYGLITDSIAGLASLSANDGRTVHGITMSGTTGSTEVDAGGNPLDVTYIQKALDNVKIKVGGSKYAYKQMIMAPESHASLIESRETDRRFTTVEDNKRGVKFFGFIHGNDVLATVGSEYCGKELVYMLPEGKNNGNKILEYAGSDFDAIRANGNGDEFRMAVSGGAYVNNMTSTLQGYGVIICNHPAAIAKVKNFTV